MAVKNRVDIWEYSSTCNESGSTSLPPSRHRARTGFSRQLNRLHQHCTVQAASLILLVDWELSPALPRRRPTLTLTSWISWPSSSSRASSSASSLLLPRILADNAGVKVSEDIKQQNCWLFMKKHFSFSWADYISSQKCSSTTNIILVLVLFGTKYSFFLISKMFR